MLSSQFAFVFFNNVYHELFNWQALKKKKKKSQINRLHSHAMLFSLQQTAFGHTGSGAHMVVAVFWIKRLYSLGGCAAPFPLHQHFCFCRKEMRGMLIF